MPKKAEKPTETLTKKELKRIQTLESKIEFNKARFPMYNSHESVEYKNVEDLKAEIEKIKQEAAERL